MGVHAFSSVPSASSLGWTIEKLYALYASKNRLCMLCENITPELTAYNAYRNANRRVRRAEGTKMYAVGDAYKVHTKCIQSAYKHKKEKKRAIPLLLLLYTVRSSLFYCPRFTGDYLLLPASSGIHGPHHTSLPVCSNRGRRRTRRSAIDGSFERYMRIVRPHGKQNYYGRHHHRPPHSARGLRKHRGGVH